jgi:hypothetical protein
MTKLSIRHTIQAVVGLILIIAPTIQKLSMSWPRLAILTQLIGGVITLSANARAVLFLKTLLDIFFPENTQPLPSTIVVNSDDNKKPTDQGFITKDLLPILAMIFCVAYSIFFLATEVRCEEVKTNEPTVAPAQTTAVPPQPEVAPSNLVPPPAAADKTATGVSQPTTESSQPATGSSQPVTGSSQPVTRDSKYGGCFGDTGSVCVAPAVALQAFVYNFHTGDMSGGVAFSGGYGIIWHTLIDLGVAVYGGVQFSTESSKAASAQGSLMFNVANYVAFGPGFLMLHRSDGPADFQATVGVAANWIPGLGFKQ